jgi:hypothetical protein
MNGKKHLVPHSGNVWFGWIELYPNNNKAKFYPTTTNSHP